MKEETDFKFSKKCSQPIGNFIIPLLLLNSHAGLAGGNSYIFLSS